MPAVLSQILPGLCLLSRPPSVQFQVHEGPRKLLLSTVDEQSAKLLQESSPSDFFWAAGVDGSGSNHLGRLLMQVREELLAGCHTLGRPASVVAVLA